VSELPADRLTAAVLRELIESATPFLALFDAHHAGDDEAPAVVREDPRWAKGLLLDFSGPRTFREAAVTDERFQFRVSMTKLYGRDISFSFRLARVLQIGGDGFAFVRPPAVAEPTTPTEPEPAPRGGLRLVRPKGE
jgi:hypothetical protein